MNTVVLGPTPRDLSVRFGGMRAVDDSYVFCMTVHPFRAFDGSNWVILSACSTVSYQKISTKHALNSHGSDRALTAKNPRMCMKSLTTRIHLRRLTEASLIVEVPERYSDAFRSGNNST